MSVDKFGRHTERTEARKGPKGDGFELTSEGDFDIKAKRLRHVKDPAESADAVNLNYLRVNCVQYGLSNEQNPFIDARHNLIRHVQEPAEINDAATKSYVDSKTPAGNQYTWDFRYRRLTNCSNPVEESDAVTLRHFNYWSPKVDTNNDTWTFSNFRLVDVGSPTGASDAVNLKYVRDNALVKNSNGVFDAGHCKLTSVGLPEAMDDAVNKRFLKHALLKFGTSLFTTILANNEITQDKLTYFETSLVKLVSEWFDK